MRQAHSEHAVQHTDDQQNTGNHKKSDAPDAHGADIFSGTRAGADNIADTRVEKAGEPPVERPAARRK